MSDNSLEERVEQLECENAELKKKCIELEQGEQNVYMIIKNLMQMVNSCVDMAKGCNRQAHIQEIYEKQLDKMIHNIKYEVCDILGKNIFFKPVMRSDEETLRLIIEEGKSLARFGDGEFSMVEGVERQKFQKVDNKLAERLKEVLQNDNDSLIVAVADNYGSLEKYDKEIADAIRCYMTDDTRALHERLLRKDRVYSDAYITRPYIIYKDNNTDAPKERFDRLKEIWNGKDIIIVEGAQSRLGMGNDLFANADSIKRILAPSTNSFDRYDDIYRECLKLRDGADMFLIALGPSAGVLAYDLSLQKIQALDVGHIDLEYEWFLAGEGVRVPVRFKYNNEIEGGNIVEDVVDEKYLSEIAVDLS